MDEEEVKYSFTGDVSSLQAATEQAISLLDKYESTIKSLASANKLDVGKTAFSGFQRTVNGIIKQVNTLSTYMSKASAESQEALAPDTTAAVSAYRNISDALALMQSGSKLTTEDMKLMTLVLQDTRKALDPIAAKATALGSSFASVARMSETNAQSSEQSASRQSAAAAQNAQAVEAANQRILAANRQLIQNAPFVAYAQQVDQQMGRAVKSAEESARAMVAAFRLEPISSGINSVADRVIAFKTTVDNAVGDVRNRFQKIVGVFDPISTKIQSFKTKTQETMSFVSKVADTVSAAFRRVAQSTDSSEAEAKQATAAHKKLATTAQQLGTAVKVEQKALKAEQTTLASKNKELKTSSKSHSSLSAIIAVLGRMFTSETGGVESFATSLNGATKSTNLLTKAFGRLTLLKIGRWFAAAVKESISYIENLNLFTVAMGESVEKGLEFVATMSEIYGMDPSNLYRYAGYFYQLTDAIGMSSDASSILSLSLTKAANDIASLFNVNIQTVVDDLASGMQGMSRSVRKYGMDIRATTLQQTALKHGLTEQVESMSEANRMALRYLTMMEQVKNATSQTVEEIDGSSEVIGDFAKNIETPANQLRIFKEQITQLGRAIGNFFIPALRAILPWLNGIVMALRTVLTTIAALLGFTDSLASSASGIAKNTSAVKGLGDAAGATAKKIQKMLAPFDELNVLSEQSGGGGGGLSAGDVLDPALQEAIANMELSLDNIRMKANDIRDAILSFLGFDWTEVFNPDTGKWETTIQWFADKFQQNLIDKFPQWSETINALFENWTAIMQGLKSLWEALLRVVGAVFSKIGELLDSLGIDNALAEGISGLAGSLEQLSTWINNNSGTLANLILIITGVVAAFRGFSAVSSLIMPVISLISTMGSAISGLGATIAVIAAVVAAIVMLYQNSEAFATSFRNLLTTLWNSLGPVGEAIVNLFSTIWGSMQRLWAEHIQPMMQQTGDALAPVLDSLAALWENVSVIVTDTANMISRVWTSTIEPVLGAFYDAIGGLMEIFQSLWETVLGPILGYIGDGLQNLWTSSLSPVVEDIIEIVGGLMELLLNLWNTVLQPLVNFVVKLFGPPIAASFQYIWGVVESAVGIIVSVLGVLTGALSGIIQFLNGIFTGDWKRALSGLANVFVSLGNGIIGVIESICNFGVSAINSFLSMVVNGVRGVVNSLGGLVEDIAGFLGYNLDLQVSWSAPQLSRVTIPRIPKVALADGGVVTRPTQALIGEGKYDEAVIPLGNSPQMRELVDQIADASSKRGSDEPLQVNVYIGNEKVAEYMAKAERKRRLQTNGG